MGWFNFTSRGSRCACWNSPLDLVPVLCREFRFAADERDVLEALEFANESLIISSATLLCQLPELEALAAAVDTCAL